MRSFFPSVALALLLLAAHAYASSPLQAFLSYSFEPGASVSYARLLCDGDYYLVSSGGHEMYVVGGSDGNTVRDISLLAALLKQDAQNRTGYDSKISSAISFPSAVNAAKAKNEAKCLQYIGDDSDPGCNDRQTCIYSCRSSPQCETLLYSDGFIESAMDWDFKRKEYSSVLGAYSEGIDAIRFDPQAIEGKISILSSLSSLAANMSQNSIFLTWSDYGCSGKNITRRCYEYCPRIDYSPLLIASQAQGLAALKLALSEIAGQRARAEAIAESGAENDAYLSSRGKDCEEFRLRMKNGIRALKAESAELAKTVSDAQIAPMISQLEGISEKAKNHSDSGDYRKALDLRVSFEALFSSASAAMGADNSSYVSLKAAMDGFSDKAKSSSWLIGSQSAAAHLAQLASLEANYSAPLSLLQISAASAALSEMGNGLDSEISSKAMQAGNASRPPLPAAPQPPSAIPDFAWIAAIALAAVLAYSFLLRPARRAPPSAPLPPARRSKG